MNDVVIRPHSDIEVFDPKLTNRKLANLEAEIVFWRKLKDWPKLEEAVDAKIDEQAEFVDWWNAGPGQRYRPPGGVVPSAGLLTAEDAEEQTGISKQAVSRWRTWLKNRDIYRQRIIRGGLRAAGLIDPTGGAEYERPIIPAGKFDTIVVDPPWDMQKIEREVRPNQVGFDYPTMSEAELLEWPVVTDMAADDCHLFCWTTEKWLPAALRIVERWGFQYCLTMVWHKTGGFQPVGLPQFNCEPLIYARRGSPRFIDTKDFFCCFVAPRREHSRKPDAFYDVVRRVTTGPRIEVFSRELREGFEQYGNEVGKFAA